MDKKFYVGETVRLMSLMPEWDGKLAIVQSYINDSVVRVQPENMGFSCDWPENAIESVEVNPTAPRDAQGNIEMPKFETINEALRFDYEIKKPKYTGLKQTRISEGLCPHCGEKGRYHLSTPVCSKHGPY